MKKLIAFAALIALLLSLGTVFAAAELPAGVAYTPGKYLGGDPEAYSTVGEITVAWLPDIASRVDLTDGDLADWYASGLPATNIDAHNMIAWVGDSTVVGDFKITTFSAADSAYLYLAFDVVDSDFAYGSEGGNYDGDAIQLALDFGSKIGDMIEKDPDWLVSVKNIFYSFSCTADGAPIQIMRQESDNDGWLSEANGDGVKGAAKKTELGWSAEIALSWELLYDDYVWKAWEDDPKIYIGSDQNLPLQVGACLYYLNRSETNGQITWAAGTAKRNVDDAGTPYVSWTPYDNGITWEFPVDGEEEIFFDCPQIVILDKNDCIGLPSGTEETETWIETETWWFSTEEFESYPLSPENWQETVEDIAESMGKEDEINAILDKYGCTSAVGLGSLTALLTMAAAAFVIRKKK
jgi:hypothetical protein